MAKVAVGSTDGIVIDAHFRQAESFDIYQVDSEDSFFLLEKRNVNGASLDEIIDRLSDVDIVLVRFIGQHAVDELAKRRVAYAAVNLPVVKALTAYAKRGKLLSNPVGECNCGEAPPRREDCPLRALKGLR
ncbi:MAG TPA: NifB/NifX family molybdenum-iron cluster-binding protein [Negativicutes bacterium]|nr:NifB/NifX family molybdenum-iron cluster-binding protein [Negativicutes bacterium]